MMYDRRRQQTDSCVLVVVVVPGEECSAEKSGVFDTAETVREIRPVFQRLELGLRKGVVVTRIRPGVGFGDAKIGHEKRHRL